MLGAFGKQLVTELKATPITLTSILGLAAFSYYAHLTHAKEIDLASHMEADVLQRAAIGRQVDRLVLLQLSSTIREIRGAWCADGPAVKTRLQATIDEYKQEYYELAGTQYVMPPCEELGH